MDVLHYLIAHAITACDLRISDEVVDTGRGRYALLGDFICVALK